MRFDPRKFHGAPETSESHGHGSLRGKASTRARRVVRGRSPRTFRRGIRACILNIACLVYSAGHSQPTEAGSPDQASQTVAVDAQATGQTPATLAPSTHLRDRIGESIRTSPLDLIDGSTSDPGSHRDRFTLLIYSSRATQEEAQQWFLNHAAALIPLPNFTIYNIIDPGPLATSRRNILRRVKSEIEDAKKRVREDLPESSRAVFDAMDVRWHVDWEGAMTQLHGIPSSRLALALLAPDGTLMDYEEWINDTVIRRVVRIVSRGVETWRKDKSRPGRLDSMVDRIRSHRDESRIEP